MERFTATRTLNERLTKLTQWVMMIPVQYRKGSEMRYDQMTEAELITEIERQRGLSKEARDKGDYPSEMVANGWIKTLTRMIACL